MITEKDLTPEELERYHKNDFPIVFASYLHREQPQRVIIDLNTAERCYDKDNNFSDIRMDGYAIDLLDNKTRDSYKDLHKIKLVFRWITYCKFCELNNIPYFNSASKYLIVFVPVFTKRKINGKWKEFLSAYVSKEEPTKVKLVLDIHNIPITWGKQDE